MSFSQTQLVEVFRKHAAKAGNKEAERKFAEIEVSMAPKPVRKAARKQYEQRYGKPKRQHKKKAQTMPPSEDIIAKTELGRNILKAGEERKKEKTEKEKQKNLTVSEYRQELWKQYNLAGQYSVEYSKLAEQLKGAKITPSPTSMYYVTSPSGKTTVMPGIFALPYARMQAMKMEEESRNLSKIQSDIYRNIQQTYDWHPKTTVIKTEKGYEIRFPFAGAEKYYPYKRKSESLDTLEKFKLAVATSFTPENPFGVPSAYYALTGDIEKATEIQIKAITSTKKRSFPEFLVSSPPVITVSLAPVGMGVAAGMTRASGYLLARGAVTTERFLRVGTGTVGAFLVGKETSTIVRDVWSGKIGEAMGRGATLGFGIASFTAGYKSVTSGWRGVTEFKKGEAYYYAKHPREPKLEWFVKPKKLWSKVVEIKGMESTGTPVEKFKFQISRLTKFTLRGAEKELHIRFPGTEGKATDIFNIKAFMSGKVRGFEITESGVRPHFEMKTAAASRFLSPVKRGTLYLGEKFSFFRLRSMSMKEIMGGGGILKTVRITEPVIEGIPSFTPRIPVATVPSSYITFPIVAPTVTYERKEYRFQPIISIQKTRRAPILSFSSALRQMKRTTTTQIEIPAFKRSNISFSLPRHDIRKDVYIETTPRYKTKLISMTFAETIPTPKVTIPSVLFPLKKRAYGRAGIFPDVSAFGKKFKFRMAKIKSPLKGIKI